MSARVGMCTLATAYLSFAGFMAWVTTQLHGEAVWILWATVGLFALAGGFWYFLAWREG